MYEDQALNNNYYDLEIHEEWYALSPATSFIAMYWL